MYNLEKNAFRRSARLPSPASPGRDWIHGVKVIKRKIWAQLKKPSLVEQRPALCQAQNRSSMNVWVDG